MIKDLADQRDEFSKVSQAVAAVKGQGYGMVTPKAEEVIFEEPELIRHGSKYGVNIKAHAPSIHMIQATIETSSLRSSALRSSGRPDSPIFLGQQSGKLRAKCGTL